MSVLDELAVCVSLVGVLQRSGVGLGEHHGVTGEGHGHTHVGLTGLAYCRLCLPAPRNPLLDLQ